MTIVIENLSKSFADRELFSQVSFRLEKGEKAGLIGANGEGKTTLMRIVMGLEEFDKGHIGKDKLLKIGYAAQNAQVTGTLWQQLVSSCHEIIAMKEELHILEAKIAASGDADTKTLLDKYALLEQAYEHAGGYDYEHKVRKIAFALGFTEDDFGKQALEFSGGQKTRMQLAAALLGEPDFLFLDEPTNHLDMAMIEWLEGYLTEYKGGLLLVSHDRYFLDRIVSKVLHLEAKRLKVYRGNYSDFVRQKELADEALQAAWEKQQEHIDKTEEYIRRFKAGIKSKQARGRQSQLNRLERICAPVRAREFHLSLPQPPESAEKTLTLDWLAVGYEKNILHDISLLIRKGEKIALLGENGAGKTTLLKTVMALMPALKGEAVWGKRVRPGYFSQGHDGLFGRETMLTHICGDHDISEERARTLLGSMLFRGDDVFKTLDELSGGERARIALLKLLLEGANFLVLDEPTNHLDIKSCEVVEDALCLWPGTILFVSHDRYFVDKIATRIWEVEQGRIVDYQGDYAYYKSKKVGRADDADEQVKRVQANTALKTPEPREQRKKPPNLERRLEAVELSLREQDALLKHLERRLADPLEHASLEASHQLAKEHELLKAKVEELLLEWERLLEWQES